MSKSGSLLAKVPSSPAGRNAKARATQWVNMGVIKNPISDEKPADDDSARYCNFPTSRFMRRRVSRPGSGGPGLRARAAVLVGSAG